MSTLRLSTPAASNGRGNGTVELEPIVSTRVPLVWDDIQPHVEEIIALNLGRISADDLYLELLQRKMQLWLIRRGKKVLMAGVTVIRVYPDCKAANVIGISGTDIDSWMKFEAELLKWAKAEGCVAIDVVARKGWLRKLKDWQELGVVLTRNLGD
jgi:hypothetical protein